MVDQGQHRISQIYLKQFGFQDKNGKWWISTWKLGDEYTNNKSIKSFTKKNNIFDLPSHNIKTRRTFEDFSSRLETLYPSVISKIVQNEKLSKKGLAILAQFMMNLLCRSVPFRASVLFLLKSNNREYFLNEITSFHDDHGKQLKDSLKKIKIDHQLNFVIISVWYYFVKKLTSSDFDYVILKRYNNHYWITTDNPVVLINNINEDTLFSLETEIYFPLTKNYCLYIDHRDYNRSNRMRGKNNDELIEVDEKTHEIIIDNIWRNAYQYVIYPENIGRIKL